MRNDWYSCDGYGAGEKAEGAPFARVTSRRTVLVGVALGAVSWLTAKSALAQVAVQPKRTNRKLIVSIFLRGGADGLNTVVPYGEDAYHRLRPTLGLASPRGGSGSAAERVLDLDGFFGFNPALAPLLPLYKDGQLAVLHAVGSNDHTRSHFEAMSAMERGLPQVSAGVSSGWLARHLESCRTDQVVPLRAVALGATMPDSLRGATDALAMESLADFRLDADADINVALRTLYKKGNDTLTEAGRETLHVLDTLNRLDPKSYKPSHGAVYPKSDLGSALEQVAFLNRAEVGLEIAALDKGGWDTHVAQGVSTGLLSGQLDDLGKSLAAFARDLGPEMANVTVVVQTEFGRRAGENSGLGTDHGRASMMFLMGGGVKGGKVYSKWPGLEAHQLEEPGDLKVTADYRDVLAEVLTKRTAGSDVAAVFPGLEHQAVGCIG